MKLSYFNTLLLLTFITASHVVKLQSGKRRTWMTCIDVTTIILCFSFSYIPDHHFDDKCLVCHLYNNRVGYLLQS